MSAGGAKGEAYGALLCIRLWETAVDWGAGTNCPQKSGRDGISFAS